MKEKNKQYVKFSKLYDKNWKAITKEDKKQTIRRKILINIFIVLYFVILVGMILSFALAEYEFEVFFCGLLIIEMIEAYNMDKILFLSNYPDNDKNRMKCMKATICDFLECDEIGINEQILFTEIFDNISKGTLRYRTKVIIEWGICLIISVGGSFVSFVAGLLADIRHLKHIIIGLILLFFIQGLFSTDLFKSFIFTNDRYHQRLVKEYRFKLAEQYLDIPK